MIRESYDTGIQVQNSLFDFQNNEVQYPNFSEIKPYYDLIDGDDSYLRIIDELLNNGVISTELSNEMKYHYNNLINVQDHDELKTEVSDFIDHFEANTKLTPEEVIICWGTASVTLFSYNYWSNVEQDPNNPWYPIYQRTNFGDNLARKKFWKIVGVIAADCAGILIGGAVGSVFGPAGAAAGAGAAGAGASAAANG